MFKKWVLVGALCAALVTQTEYGMQAQEVHPELPAFVVSEAVNIAPSVNIEPVSVSDEHLIRVESHNIIEPSTSGDVSAVELSRTVRKNQPSLKSVLTSVDPIEFPLTIEMSASGDAKSEELFRNVRYYEKPSLLLVRERVDNKLNEPITTGDKPPKRGAMANGYRLLARGEPWIPFPIDDKPNLSEKNEQATSVRPPGSFARSDAELPGEADGDPTELSANSDEPAYLLVAVEGGTGKPAVNSAGTPSNGFTQASLAGPNLAGIDLRGRKDLQGTSFRGKNLYQALLSGASIVWGDFSQAKLEEANLNGAIMAFADFTKADLSRASMAGTNLQGANLQGANLTGVDLSNANLQGVNLLWANFSKANLSGANLTQTNPAWSNMKGAKYNDKTRFPAGFSPEEHGMIKVK